MLPVWVKMPEGACQEGQTIHIPSTLQRPIPKPGSSVGGAGARAGGGANIAMTLYYVNEHFIQQTPFCLVWAKVFGQEIAGYSESGSGLSSNFYPAVVVA